MDVSLETISIASGNKMRYIRTHTPSSGTSITAPSPLQFHHGRAGVGGMARSYSATSVPAILAHSADIAACAICVLGVAKMELDGGEMLTLKLGMSICASNGSATEAARFVAVTLPYEPFEIGQTGKMLAEEHVEGSGAKKADGSRL
ncbi:uncharacterized protein K441DRAFT_687483 [Cenococcum geophilum 1.58]|uniref:uncharacterized protein n=1 Tax=Cenococcum geophilum 1.58 TaxID=794803 RepID=UPI00358F81A5|nr:hypothetical protein K441DRAFT_687483 [Cenococcum geophilum 1.58]